MVHLRLNARETNPNEHINFTTALPWSDHSEEDARQLLRALAAQVRPVMKSHGFVINSFEEYEYNSVFAGRNWNNGETVELVLRRPGGSFFPNYWLLGTLCHELAHIKHMNHGPAFQALWKQLRVEVRQLQDKGYYGDGYWSSGTRLADSSFVAGDTQLQSGELPEYMCGGAQRRSRTAPSRKRRRRPNETGASNKTGRQTAKKRKAGGRNTSKYAFQGNGVALNVASTSANGTGFRKQAGSKRAREERALAAERRMQALKNENDEPSSATVRGVSDDDGESSSDDSDVELVAETDIDRKNALLEAKHDDDIDLHPAWEDFEDDFIFTSGTGTGAIIDIPSNGDEDNGPPTSKGKGMVKPEETPKLPDKKKRPGDTATSFGNIVKDEINLRKKESLGMGPGSTRRLDGGRQPPPRGVLQWPCQVCTLLNESEQLACAACDTLRPDVKDQDS